MLGVAKLVAVINTSKPESKAKPEHALTQSLVLLPFFLFDQETRDSDHCFNVCAKAEFDLSWVLNLNLSTG